LKIVIEGEAMASKSKRARTVKQRNLAKDFMYWAIAVFVIKLIIIGNVQGGAWLGADGENYLKGLDGLLKDGLFSKEPNLSYWPAGYPLLIFPFALVKQSLALTIISILQSAVYSYAVFLFGKEILSTRLAKFSYFTFLLVLLNPTLSLSSVSVGYESLAASGILIICALVIRHYRTGEKTWQTLIPVSLISSFITFLQPRLIVGCVFVVSIWIYTKFGRKRFIFLTSISILIMMILPSALIARNVISKDVFAISTNLGITMAIGAGDGATGGYVEWKNDYCVFSADDIAEQDNKRVKCVLDWYKNNPGPALKLFYNKSLYFWSPWSGPGANGTMARNPWLKINPLIEIAKNPDGNELVYGEVGKVFGWLWLLSGLGLVIYGFRILWKQGATERFIATVSMVSIGSSWLVTLISIGDHRFRLPIMGLSLFLQAVGLRTLLKAGKPPMVDGPGLR